MSKTNASPTNFGWDFQINAGIVLLVDNFSEMVSIRAEGQTEDIEITLSNGKKVYAQAKSIVKSDDYRNVKQKCVESIKTLNNACKNNDCKEIIYITNTPNPLSNQKTMHQFYGAPRIKYEDLIDKNQSFVDNILKKQKIEDCFDKDKFKIHILPFFTDDFKERYRIVRESIKDILGTIDSKLTIYTDKIMATWQQDLFRNASVINITVEISKRQLLIPVIVEELNSTSIEEYKDRLDLDLDKADIEEILTRYSEIINNSTDNFEFFTKIIAEYNKYRETNRKNCESDFIKDCWELFKDSFEIEGFSATLQQALTKIVINKVIDTRYRTRKILEGSC